jgi:hypothetical protein
MNIQRILQIHKVSFSILVFVILLSFVHFVIRPAIIYNTDGSFKQFGIGYRNKTVTPIWLICIILGIFSYLFVCWMARVGV